MEQVRQVIMAGIGATGLAMLFKSRARYLLVACASGVIVSGIYFILYIKWGSVFIASMSGAVFAGTWAEIMARVMKAPTNIFLIPAIVPLLPGGSLFYTMYWWMQKNSQLYQYYKTNTVNMIFGITLGTLIASVIFEYCITKGIWYIIGNQKKGGEQK